MMLLLMPPCANMLQHTEQPLRSRFPSRTIVRFGLPHHFSRSSTHCEGGNYRIIITTEREELGIQPDVVARRQVQLASLIRTQRSQPQPCRQDTSSSSWNQNNSKRPSSKRTSNAGCSGWPHLCSTVPRIPPNFDFQCCCFTRTVMPVRTSWACKRFSSISEIEARSTFQPRPSFISLSGNSNITYYTKRCNTGYLHHYIL